MGASKIIECIYEDGVFKPLEKVDLKQGTRLSIRMGRGDLSNYWGVLGKASAEKLAELEGEAQVQLLTVRTRRPRRLSGCL